MKFKDAFSGWNAAHAAASIFGVLSGLGSLVHGIGETLQGSVAPQGLIINSWTTGPIATNMGGEPGMTIVPNLLITGLLTIVVSLAVIVWSAAFVQRKQGGLVLLLLSIASLLFGGGFGPPIMGILSSLAGFGIQAPGSEWWRAHLPTAVQRGLAYVWPWVFAVCVINGVFLVIGSVVLVYFFGLNAPDLFVNSFFFAVLSILLTIVTGIGHDLQQKGQEARSPG